MDKLKVPLPNFQSLWRNYPRGSSEDVKQRIGGKVNRRWITNTCAIRVSRAMNYSGAKMPRHIESIGGGDRLRYAFRVRALREYFRTKYGKPSRIERRTDAIGKLGIILFEECGFSDASGHIDIWNGLRCAGQDYFPSSKKISLWSAASSMLLPSSCVVWR